MRLSTRIGVFLIFLAAGYAALIPLLGVVAPPAWIWYAVLAVIGSPVVALLALFASAAVIGNVECRRARRSVRTRPEAEVTGIHELPEGGGVR